MVEEENKRPLITLAVFSYNQEAYVREAVVGAFSQTYSPLEIILSDDCSTDGTFDIMKSMASEYRGSHRVKLNKNEENLGIGPHVDKVDRMAEGEWVVHAAADDVSLPHRVDALFNAWVESDRKPSLIVSNAECVNEKGEHKGYLVNAGKQREIFQSRNPLRHAMRVIGCTVAVHKNLSRLFAPLDRRIMAEDVVLHRRAYLAGGVLYIPEVLVKYRINERGASQLAARRQDLYLKQQLRWTTDRLLRLEQLKADVEHCESANKEEIFRDVERQRLSEERRIHILTAGFASSGAAMLAEMCLGRKKWSRMKSFIRDFVIRWFPELLGFERT